MATPCGLLTPFRRDASDIASGTGADLLRSKVGQVVGVEPGELPWRTGFGAGTHALRHRKNDAALAALATARVRAGFAAWAKQAALVSVDPSRPAANVLELRVAYRDQTGATPDGVAVVEI